jgi:hypothetical protein
VLSVGPAGLASGVWAGGARAPAVFNQAAKWAPGLDFTTMSAPRLTPSQRGTSADSTPADRTTPSARQTP